MTETEKLFGFTIPSTELAREELETDRDNLIEEVKRLRAALALEKPKPLDRPQLEGVNKLTVIHCETKDLYDKVAVILKDKRYTAVNGKDFTDFNHWQVRERLTCIWPSAGISHSLKYFESEEQPIITAEEFLRLNS